MMEMAFNKPFQAQLDFFRQKGFEISEHSWRDVWQAAHARAFTVARVTAMDVLADIRQALDAAKEGGVALRQFKKDLVPTLTQKGWMAPKGDAATVVMPDGTIRKRLTGWRLNTIYRVNLGSAYHVGRYEQLMAVKKARPFWQYRSQQDPSVRDEHRALDGKVYHADHPFWDQWYPPNGWNCRCYVKSLSERQMKARGLKEETRGVDIKPDEGWRYNVGKAGLDHWKPDLSKYSAETRTLLEAAMKRPLFLEMTSAKEVAEFIKNRNDLPSRLRPFITPHTAKDYSALGAEIHMTPDGKAGYAITKEKELVSVFSKPGAHLGAAAVRQAVEKGAMKLDCFDGFLPNFYSKFRFIEYNRIEWDDEYAPDGWNYEEFGRPDVVFMRIVKKGQR